jgi:predicted O-methyltransferase YrrM
MPAEDVRINLAFLDRACNHTAIDKCHAMMIYGSALAHKPRRILELGIGTGLVTGALLSAIGYNGLGDLTCVDICLDFGGEEPTHFDCLREAGARIVIARERDFLSEAQADSFDFLVSDADHSAVWIEEYFRVTASGAICFFHDTNTLDYAGLYGIAGYAERAGYSHFHFTRSSRPDERCERGILMVVNGKAWKERLC